jgi:hypothetical protein
MVVKSKQEGGCDMRGGYYLIELGDYEYPAILFASISDSGLFFDKHKDAKWLSIENIGNCPQWRAQIDLHGKEMPGYSAYKGNLDKVYLYDSKLDDVSKFQEKHPNYDIFVFDNTKLYCAIIGDIVKSRNIKNRVEAQYKFEDVLSLINTTYDSYLASNFTVTLGDEFQGLLYEPYIFYEIIKKVKEMMYPIELVFGVGVGEMEIPFEKNMSIGSDGPAYHYARQMVQKAKDYKSAILYYSNSLEDELLNALMLLIQSCERKHSKKQKEIIKKYKELNSQYKVAEEAGITQTTVSVLLSRALYYEIKDAEEKLKKFLKIKYMHNSLPRLS